MTTIEALRLKNGDTVVANRRNRYYDAGTTLTIKGRHRDTPFTWFWKVNDETEHRTLMPAMLVPWAWFNKKGG